MDIRETITNKLKDTLWLFYIVCFAILHRQGLIRFFDQTDTNAKIGILDEYFFPVGFFEKTLSFLCPLLLAVGLFFIWVIVKELVWTAEHFISNYAENRRNSINEGQNYGWRGLIKISRVAMEVNNFKNSTMLDLFRNILGQPNIIVKVGKYLEKNNPPDDEIRPYLEGFGLLKSEHKIK